MLTHITIKDHSVCVCVHPTSENDPSVGHDEITIKALSNLVHVVVISRAPIIHGTQVG